MRAFSALFTLLVLSPCLAFLGCTTATSLNTSASDVSARNGLVNGTYYYIPEGTIVLSGLVEPADRDVKDQPTVHKGDFTLTAAVDLRPDRTMRFFFRPDENVFLDSDTRLIVNDKALLDTVTSATLGKGAPAALTIAQMAPVPLDFGAEPAGDAVPFTYRFDPFNAAQVAAVRRELGRRGIRLDITPALAASSAKPDPKAMQTGTRDPAAPVVADQYSGILFRPVVPLTLTFRTGNAALGDQEILLCVPDKRSLLAFNLERGLLIDKSVELQFHDGVLVASHIGKPGLVTSLINIPLNMIHTVFTGGM
ncbi:hypothetical protein SAMN05444156_3201 [Verrucomicrobium sp. GAS474]|uniref:hypothetical protein n=1 Tax=Verrucomicrobium sp. GAS474 TaxID=1882831 RepID=UPI00087D2348|nr:hypothetical protein [Verrucomicrobium sp. GAS474]SDU30776.1 hypothetical protein SAMN05444156_3201 [Verrucomicrobium sp. GAS474]